MTISKEDLKNLLLQADDCGILDEQDVIDKIQAMKSRKEILQNHNQKIWRNDRGVYCTHVYEGGKRRRRERRTLEELEDCLVEFYQAQEERITMKDVCCRWLDEKLSYGEIQRQSYDRYMTDCNRFFKESVQICQKNFRNITSDDIEKFLKETIRDKKLTRKTYKGLATLVNGTFKYGKHKKLIDLSITEVKGDIVLPDKIFARKEAKIEEAIFYEDELDVFMGHLKSHLDIWNLAILLMFQTGLRVGELTALKRKDIGLDCIYVRRTERKVKDSDGHSHVEVQEHAKTDAGYRTVLIPSQAQDTLRRIQALSSGEYLFVNQKGQRIRGTTITKRLYDTCKKLGIARHSSHKVRRTYGTTLLDSGMVDDAVVAEQMGHKSVETTRKMYYFSNKQRKSKALQIQQAINF